MTSEGSARRPEPSSVGVVTSTTAAHLPPDPAAGFGPALRSWRERRHLSQLELSLRSGVSGRHLSFLETGRSKPSRGMVLQLADHLDVPLRERNLLLTAAGFAPAYAQRPYDAPELHAVRDAVRTVLDGHDPYPALAVDRCWNLLEMNAATGLLVEMVTDASLLEPPVNVYRLALHPGGLAPRIVDPASFAHHLLDRLRRDIDATGDPALIELRDEVAGYAGVPAHPVPLPPADAVVVPVRLRHPEGELALFSTVATFGTPADVTVAEVTLETFFPHDRATAERLRDLADLRAGRSGR
jgi:transcriptional regulator with XRE-family HTH domain